MTVPSVAFLIISAVSLFATAVVTNEHAKTRWGVYFMGFLILSRLAIL